jgi:hypothetical protein
MEVEEVNENFNFLSCTLLSFDIFAFVVYIRILLFVTFVRVVMSLRTMRLSFVTNVTWQFIKFVME